MLVICMSVSWVVLEWYLSHDFIVGNKNLSSCKSVYYVLYKCCFLLFSQVTYLNRFIKRLTNNSLRIEISYEKENGNYIFSLLKHRQTMHNHVNILIK